MQSSRSVPGLFISGTGTGVGKTYVAAIVARALAAQGRRVGVYKPVASGCRADDAGLVSDDAVILWEAAGRPGELERVCPQRFGAPLAPHLAARAEGRRVDRELLRSGLDYWLERSDVVLIEGAGGLLSPVDDDEYQADLAADFGFPLLMVASDVLGTINQTLSALVVAATFRDGLDVVGVVLNQPSPPPHDASTASNYAELRARAVPPVVARIGWQATSPDEPVDWFGLGGS
ncbi:MAG: dethiobiotin synthase [Pirellulales bacterium]